mmetsp:Transcript_3583/g.9162  ORF Transcript_3583/g.9162 Transcript_3583/m.9162 type:complete len:235 (+) Transcript_3583:192-896(+)|eukprot:CAMPEP_0181139878 /NCGR_PEP_ID=MMETSP1071-20121207/35013_1 /TAXON_ID=35127 /ORGANISM="Thalassiosira sp., Strain NH16" /LENGTH=234 /DNA_ID=CAMNT_0023226807 /DNA_START=122 /DNA_END=826 /DNA_ORIENTATION=+
MKAAAAKSLLVLCTAVGIRASAPSNAHTRHGRRLPAFCASTNSSTGRQQNRPTSIRIPLRASEKEELRAIIEESKPADKEMGTWNPLSLAVLKLGFTEPAWTSPFNYKKAEGTYVCADCRSPLFPSSSKYDSGSGWPSFWKSIESNRVSLEKQWDGRIECTCAKCGGHLGHVFPDGPTRGSLDAKELETVPESDPQIGYKVQGSSAGDKESKYSRMPRFCVNGAAMRFEEGGQL